MTEIQFSVRPVATALINIVFPETYEPSAKQRKLFPKVPFQRRCGSIYFDVDSLHLLATSITLQDFSSACNVAFMATTIITRDSESQMMCLELDKFDMIIANDVTNKIEDAMSEALGECEIDVTFTYPDDVDPKHRELFETWVQSTRYPYFIALWTTVFRIDTGITLDTTQQSMRTLKGGTEALLALNKIRKGKSFIMEHAISREVGRNFVYVNKVAPLTVNEFAHKFDIRYRIWREAYTVMLISRQYQLIRAEYHTNTFSIPFTHYRNHIDLVYDMDGEYFENHAIIGRFIMSDQVTENQRQLAQLIEKSAETDVGADTMEKLTKFATISRDLAKDIIMANHSLVIYSQNVSRNSFEDIKNISQFDALFNTVLGGLIFLHHKIGIIHGDLHLGNVGWITCEELALDFGFTRTTPFTRNSIIFDFSRSIINPYHPLARKCTESSLEVVAREQTDLIITMYERIFPSGELSQSLRKLLTEDFEVGFRIASILDCLDMLSKLVASPKIQSMHERGFGYIDTKYQNILMYFTKLVDDKSLLTDIDPLVKFMSESDDSPTRLTIKIDMTPFDFDFQI